MKSCCQWMGTIVQYGNILVTLIYRRKPKTSKTFFSVQIYIPLVREQFNDNILRLSLHLALTHLTFDFGKKAKGKLMVENLQYSIILVTLKKKKKNKGGGIKTPK